MLNVIAPSLAWADASWDVLQCFLLTPKLLPDLPFSPAVTVLQIMNGPHIAEIAKNYSPQLLFGRRQPQACA